MPDEFAGMPLVRKSDGHKGLYGNILIVAGSAGKSGAAVMAGSAALWAGAGLVTVATPDVVLPIVAAAHPEYMTESLVSTDAGTASSRNIFDLPPMPTSGKPEEMDAFHEEHSNSFHGHGGGKTVLAVGPGLGMHHETQEFVRSMVKRTDLPIILDADGLNAFGRRSDELRDRQSKFLAITPHPGEMARLMGSSVKEVEADRVKTATEAAKRWNAHVILKGSHTIIAAPDGRFFVNTTGNAGLSKGGSGDVLTGVLAAMTGQFKTDDWLQTLALGVYSAWSGGGSCCARDRFVGDCGERCGAGGSAGPAGTFAGVATAWLNKIKANCERGGERSDAIGRRDDCVGKGICTRVEGAAAGFADGRFGEREDDADQGDCGGVRRGRRRGCDESDVYVGACVWR